MDPYFAFGRHDGGGIREYPDRREIELGALEGRGLEIAFAESRMDLFFVHIQGAARLHYQDGQRSRITYAAKTGHRFTPIGRILVERGEIPREAVTMDTIREWLAAHPGQLDELLWQNRSFIFFRENACRRCRARSRRGSQGSAFGRAVAGRGSPDPHLRHADLRVTRRP